jgi:hypothetical protein
MLTMDAELRKTRHGLKLGVPFLHNNLVGVLCSFMGFASAGYYMTSPPPTDADVDLRKTRQCLILGVPFF